MKKKSKYLFGFASGLAKISGDPLTDNFRRDNIAGSHGSFFSNFAELKDLILKKLLLQIITYFNRLKKQIILIRTLATMK